MKSMFQIILAMLPVGTFVWEPDGLSNAEEGLVPRSMTNLDRLGTALITSEMNSECVMAYLVQHGCNNITDDLDLQNCNNYPLMRGGFGTVYQGMLKDGQLVAIKCIESSIIHDTNVPEYGKDLKRAAREIYTWSRCNHQGVLPMLGFARFRGQIALITPWRQAGSLKQNIIRGSLLPLQACIQLATAVEYLHLNGIVHGDIKPDNALVTDQGQVQLADFGSAISILATALNFTRTGSFNFTTRFAAPEVLKEESRTFTKESDVYSLGMTMLYVVTGQVPFADKREVSVIIEVVFKKGKPSQPDFDDNLWGDVAKIRMWDLLRWCFAYEPKDRPKASQIKEALIEIERLNSTIHSV
ncbi:protein tyrosine kinase, putative [Rhizoctonia solani]|uniref:Protein tyrosine kinase, putative n=1 Tax=Rhizoctonia solani TaxID=456999 RepID=A0A0K6FSB0_9AGAM|nr:protein tyrosine kinase, putative [Rhizoctonia solani]